MKRMVDNKKVREIEANSGTKWYEHKIILKDSTALTLITLRKDPLKDEGWPVSNHIAFLVAAGGRSVPDVPTTFHILSNYGSSVYEIKYINASNQISTYTLNVSDIASEKVTGL